MSARTLEPNPRTMQLEQTVLRGAVWAFIGVFFGFIFVVLMAYLQGFATPSFQLLGATAGAAGLTALFYGSMRLTVMVANFTFIAMVFYTWGNAQLTLEPLIYIGAIVGLVVGAVYGAKDKRSRVFCAEAKIVAGVFSGILASVLGLLAGFLFDGPLLPWAGIIVAPAATLIYVSSAYWFVDRCHRFLATGSGWCPGRPRRRQCYRIIVHDHGRNTRSQSARDALSPVACRVCAVDLDRRRCRRGGCLCRDRGAALGAESPLVQSLSPITGKPRLSGC